MEYLPIFIRLTEQPVLVVGGGEVAARKIELLLRAGAHVTVVAPELISSLAEKVASGTIEYLDVEFHPDHLIGKRLAIAATSKRAVNAWVAIHRAGHRRSLAGRCGRG
jgi:uroporphyrin-III C-methyltransferase/precorrin-2 dehydrogenase/sirohydrochlorin ferrochelatase